LTPALPGPYISYNFTMKLSKRNMQTGGLRRWLMPALVAGFVGLLADQVWAQKRVPAPEDTGAMLRYGVALGVVVICGFAAFLNPKRSHK